MPESLRPRQRALIALVAGAALSVRRRSAGLVAGFGGWRGARRRCSASAGCVALRASGSATAGPATSGSATSGSATMRRDALALLALWGVALATTAALVAWPLSALRESASLGAALS